MLVGNVVADFDTLKRWYFNLNSWSQEKEDIINAYDRRNKKCDEPVLDQCDRSDLQPMGESEGPRTNKRRTCKQTKPVCGGTK